MLWQYNYVKYVETSMAFQRLLNHLISVSQPLDHCPLLFETSPVAQMVKNPPAMQEAQETWVQSLGWEDPLEKGMATHSSIPA